ncbi:MAG: GldG family protein, partial [Pseudomonadales bacterium]|nr:GldG family protein [Pseudomonadales bacterium]
MRGLRGIRHRLVSGGGIVMVALATLLALLLQDRALEGWRLDLTEDRLWTLSKGTRALLAGLQTDVELRLYFSRSIANDAPEWSDHARYVTDSLLAFERASRGRLALRRIDPRPLSDAAAAARAAGLEPARLDPTGEELYLGVVARTADGRERVLPRIDPADAALLEYRVAQLLEGLLRTRTPRLALISGVPMVAEGGRGAGAMRRRLAERFDLLEGPPEEVSARLAEADVLMLVHPRGLPEDVVWAVDQFALTGGRVLLLVDPLAERDPAAEALAFANPFASRASDARVLLARWGISPPSQVVLDAEHAMPVTLAPGRPPIPHLAMLALTRDGFSNDDPV